MSEENQKEKKTDWGGRCSYKLDMVLSRLDRVLSMLFHTKALLTTEEAAMYLGITTGHLYRIVRKFDIPHSPQTNGKIYFKKEELDRWVATRTGTTETEDTDTSDSTGPMTPMNDLYIN